jgi:hypothetical protein
LFPVSGTRLASSAAGIVVSKCESAQRWLRA